MDAISAAVSVISLLCTCSERKICQICKLKDNQESLRVAIEELKRKRNDVKSKVDSAERNPNERMKCTEEVEGWLEQVQAMEIEVDEVFDKVDRQTGGTCLGNYCPLNCWSGYKLGKSVVQKLESVETLISRGGNFAEVAYGLPPPSVQEILVDETVGMDSVLEEALRLLGNDGVKILGLYGAGGVGKTTLLTRINNEFEKRRHDFDVIIWAVVSRPLNVANIQKQIGERLGISDGNLTAVNISSALKNKRFMLLLDDLWERVDLRSIGIPPHGSNSNSKIVLTTRFEDVCTSMRAVNRIRVNCLEDDEAWSLFRENLGDEALISDPQILELAKEVAKECAGLPLALITIGRAMSNKKTPQEWKYAVTTLKKAASEFPGMDDKVLPILKLSYDSLRDKTTQSCFLYCSLYPEDYEIKIEKLIELWIVEGLLEGFDDITDEAHNRGYHVIGSLKSACLLENGLSKYGSKSEPDTLKMHDVIRDLALWIVSECGKKKKNKFVGRQGVTFSSRLTEPFKEWKDAERISLYHCQIDTTYPIEPPDCPNLSTLLFTYNIARTTSPLISNNFFECMPSLRTLDLSRNTNLTTFPTSICGLVGLEYLNLSGTGIEKLPHELKNLVKLKYLNLRCTRSLREIPGGILFCLSKLQLLNLHDSGFTDWEMDEEEGVENEGGGRRQMSLLGELNTLKYMVDLRIKITTRAAVQRLSLSSSRNLHMCTTDLLIGGCQGLRSLGLSPPSSTTTTTTFNLGYLKNLRYLHCEMCWDLEELRIGWMPPTDHQENIGFVSSTLETLHLFLLPKLIIDWDKRMMAHAVQGCYYFNNLRAICIVGCEALTDLTWLVCLSNLERLEVTCCERIEEIIAAAAPGFEDEMSSLDFFFRSLKKIDLKSLPSLKSICRQSLAFPCLEAIKIRECPELKALPLDSTTSNVNNTLKNIEGNTEWWNQLQWADEISESKFRPYHNPVLF